MTVATSKVKGRRKLRFESYDDLTAEADRLAAGEVEMLGNWKLSEVFDHLAKSLDSSIDGGMKPFPAPMRWMLRLLMKKKFLDQEVPSGFTFPDDAKAVVGPDSEADVRETLERLHRACERCKSESQRAVHPGFGELTREEWDRFNLRHAEMHLGFAKPV